MRPNSLPNPARFFPLLVLATVIPITACGRKGDPIPRPRTAPQACTVVWSGLRTLDITLPRQDIRQQDLAGLHGVRLYYAPLGAGRPTAAEILARGEVLLERSRPDLPAPGKVLRLDLSELGRPAGWIVVVAVRVGGVLGQPSETVPWIHPAVHSMKPVVK